MISRLLVGIIFFITLLLMLVYIRTQPDEPVHTVSDEYRFISTPCWFAIPWPENIRCGELHTASSTGRFVLPVVVIEDSNNTKKSDAVFYLQGGPGSGAGLDDDGIRYWLGWRDNMALGRDIILMDPRGTGHSRPALTCPEYDQFSLAILKRNAGAREELAEGYKILEACFARLRQAEPPFNPGDYGTQRHAQDVYALMGLLPYEHWNLVGVSYGTRVALEVASMSTSVRSLILDSVYPSHHGGIHSFPAVLDQAFSNFFNWCAGANNCLTDMPIEQALDKALHKLHDEPVTLTVARRNGDIPLDLVVNDHRFISAVFSALYSKHQWPRIPVAIDAVLNGQQPPLQSLMEPFVNNALSEDFNGLVFMAVDCGDHGISTEQDFQQALRQYPRWNKYIRDLWQYQACHFLSASVKEVVEHTTIPAIPMLILAGELDPITPAEWAEELHQHAPASQLHIVPNTGHAVINSDECVYQSLRNFLDEPDRTVSFCGAE